MYEDPIDDWMDWRSAHSIGDDLTSTIAIVLATLVTFVLVPLLL